MKIWRFNGWRSLGQWHTSYGYIKANFFERIYLRGRIAAGDTGLWEIASNYYAPGPASYGAQFIVTAKPKTRRTYLRYGLWAGHRRPGNHCNKTLLQKIFGWPIF